MSKPPDNHEKKAKDAPGRVSTRSTVTVAFPFSTIRMDGDDDRLAELAAIVADLAEQVGHLAPSKAVTALHERAVALHAALEA
jgi:hypothetical protein